MAILSKPLHAVQKETRGVALTIVAFAASIAILYFGRVFFITSLVAVGLAFVLEPFVALLMRIRFPRGLASFVVCVGALALVYLIGLGAYSQMAGLVEDLPKYTERIGDLVDNIQQRVEGMEERTYQLLVPARLKRQAVPPPTATGLNHKKRSATVVAPPTPGAIPEVRIHEDSKPINDFIYARLGSFYEGLLMASFVPFLVYFMLSWRDHINRSFLQFFQGADRVVAARSLQGMAGMVRAFVVGNSLLGLLLAVITSAAFWFIHLPYPMLAGPLSGFLSLIPYIGLPLALLPPLLVALPVFTTLPPYLLVIAIVSLFHLLALNLFYPKLVGSRVHLNPLAVTFSLMFWGFLWDAPGLLLAIPLTAAFKAVCDNVQGLRHLGKFLGD